MVAPEVVDSFGQVQYVIDEVRVILDFTVFKGDTETVSQTLALGFQRLSHRFEEEAHDFSRGRNPTSTLYPSMTRIYFE